MKRLAKWDWNDGEVAEVYSAIFNVVSYIEGKKTELK